MSVPLTTTIRITHRFSAKPERLYDAWIDAKNIGKWLFATETGQMVRVDVDARLDGGFVITERRDGEDVEHVGTYIELNRPKKLVFDFSLPQYSSRVTRVGIDIASLPKSAGSELTLTHDGVETEHAGRTESGWVKILSALETYLAK